MAGRRKSPASTSKRGRSPKFGKVGGGRQRLKRRGRRKKRNGKAGSGGEHPDHKGESSRKLKKKKKKKKKKDLHVVLTVPGRFTPKGVAAKL